VRAIFGNFDNSGKLQKASAQKSDSDRCGGKNRPALNSAGWV
jgi:hypothetical protein